MIWIDLTEEELVLLTLRDQPVPESVRQKALQMTHDAFLARLHANAAKPAYVKHSRRTTSARPEDLRRGTETSSSPPTMKGESVPGLKEPVAQTLGGREGDTGR